MARQWRLTVRGGSLPELAPIAAPYCYEPAPLQERVVLGHRRMRDDADAPFLALGLFSRRCRVGPDCTIEIHAGQQRLCLLGPSDAAKARAARYVHVDHALPSPETQWSCPVRPGSLVQLDNIVLRIDIM
jgi:hypothetical protein